MRVTVYGVVLVTDLGVLLPVHVGPGEVGPLDHARRLAQRLLPRGPFVRGGASSDMLRYQTPPQQPPPTASDRHALHALAPAQPRLPSCDTVHQTNLILQTSGDYEPTQRIRYTQAYREHRSTDRLTWRNKLVGLALGMLSSHPALLCQYPLCYSLHLKARSLGPSSFLGFGRRASRPPAGSLGYCNADPERLRHLLTPMRQRHRVVSTYCNTNVAIVVTRCRYLHGSTPHVPAWRT